MDPATTHCARCGHALGIGRFCVNCGEPRADDVAPGGTPLGDHTDTAERPAAAAPPTVAAPAADQPAARPPSESPWGPPAPPMPSGQAAQPGPSTTPPPAYETPPKARYPLWADGSGEPAEATVVVPQPAAWEGPASDVNRHRARRSIAPVLLVVLVLAAAAVGAFLLLGGGDDGDDRADDPPAGDTRTDGAGPGQQSSDGPGSTGSTDPTSQPPPSSPTTTKPPAPGEPRDVARDARASASRTAPASTDVDGNAVRYDAFNMLDGQPDTAWRAPGDGRGVTVRFELGEPTSLTEVGLINGYAKQQPGYDGYHANRRIISVDWVFADGTVVSQTFDQDTTTLQTMPVDVVTDTVEVRIVATTRPAKGPSGRNFTAISEVSLVGTPV